MKQSENDVQVGTVGDRVCVRVEGKGTHLNSPSLREFLTGMIEAGYRDFRLDLSRCTYMDSTFLGTLVGISTKLNRTTAHRLVILDANARSRESFHTLGVELFFQFEDGSTPHDGNLQALPEAQVSMESKAQTMLDAHEALTQADERNVCRFKDVILFLKEDLQRIRAGKAGPPTDPSRR